MRLLIQGVTYPRFSLPSNAAEACRRCKCHEMKAGSASRPEFVKRAEHQHVKAALQVDKFSGFSSGEVRGKRREDCVGGRKAFSDGVSPRSLHYYK